MATTTVARSKAFWEPLRSLREELVSMHCAERLLIEIGGGDATEGTTSREELIEKIEALIAKFYADVSKGVLPKFTVIKSNGDRFHGNGIHCCEISLSHVHSLRKYTVTMNCLSACYKLLLLDKRSTKRDVFYSNVNLYGKQHRVDDSITDIACILDVPRHALHILSTAKGLVYGCLSYTDTNGVAFNCWEQILQVPSQVENIRNFHSNANYVLVIEKEAIFQRLAEHRLHEKLGPSIIITAKGFPDINTRLFISKLCASLSIPVLALVDADPHGIEIMCVYKFGSKSMSHEARRLACPSMRWLGIHPKDVRMGRIEDRVLIPLTPNDLKKAHDLLKRDYISEYAQQIQQMIDSGVKAEIECLDSISHSYITDVYLPLKLRNGDWI